MKLKLSIINKILVKLGIVLVVGYPVYDDETEVTFEIVKFSEYKKRNGG